jgi:membrane protein implicated in regulation of membrane protease activity
MDITFSAYYWLAAGAVLMLMEVLLVPGIGFLFMGLAAVITGLLVWAGVSAENIYGQFAWFFGFTIVWAVLLWKTLKSFRLNPKAGQYDNIVGTDAVVHGTPLVRGVTGQVQWSGTLMNAELTDDAPGEIPVGAKVEIAAVKGNTVFVRPRG